MSLRAQKPLRGPSIAVPDRSVWRRRAAALGVLGLTFLATLALVWTLVQPTFERQAASIPGDVRAQLRANHAAYTPGAAIAPAMRAAVVAIEDRRFYQHHGVDLYGMARALLQDAAHGNFDQGGATINDQLVERAVALPANPILRALDILGTAWTTDTVFSRSHVLTLYLNSVYFGRGAYGVGAAAHVYFHTTPARLDIAQAAYLAALPQAPSYYGSHPRSAVLRARVRAVVEGMRAQGAISGRQERVALGAGFY